ncbi:MAG: phosphoenolpyruvate--protein phosphotransferase [Agarilytica sp.]
MTTKQPKSFPPKAPSKAVTRKKLPALRQILTDVADATNLDVALRVIVKGVVETLAVEECSVYLSDDIGKRFILMATEAHPNELVGKWAVALEEGVLGLIGTVVEPLNLPDVKKHGAYSKNSIPGGEQYRGFLGVPIVYQSEVCGVIVAQSKKSRVFKESSLSFLLTLSSQIATCIVLAKLRGEIAHTTSLPTADRLFIEGQPGSPGIALGIGTYVGTRLDLKDIPDRQPDSVDDEVALFQRAIKSVAEEYRSLGQESEKTIGEQNSVLFEAYAQITEGPELVENTIARIHGGNWAAGALRETVLDYISQFNALDNAYLRERANDIEEIGKRLLNEMLASNNSQDIVYPENTILIGEDLSPADIINVPSGCLKAVISGRGSAYSHLAIFSKAIGVPAVLGMEAVVPLAQLDKKPLVVNGSQGRLYVEPDGILLATLKKEISREASMWLELDKLAQEPALTTDGFRVSLLTNAGIAADLSHSVAVGSEGVGLYRTEFPFMNSEGFLTEQEQYELYKGVLSEMAPLPVSFRTLDIGGDKPLPYWRIHEQNPFLGWRGIRILLDQPEIFLCQIRALFRANVGLNNLKILLPMVNSIDDLESALELIAQVKQELKEQGVDVGFVPVGVMIEVPSAVYQIKAFAKHVDFLSIGSNDLTQYLLAVDRNNERVTRWYSYFHPAVISAIQSIIVAGDDAGIPVSICGEAAGDPSMAILLLGMGMDVLSLSAGDLPRIKKVILSISKDSAKTLAKKALTLDKAKDVEQLLDDALGRLGLSELICSMSRKP